jgi:hypothetical protein
MLDMDVKAKNSVIFGFLGFLLDLLLDLQILSYQTPRAHFAATAALRRGLYL